MTDKLDSQIADLCRRISQQENGQELLALVAQLNQLFEQRDIVQKGGTPAAAPTAGENDGEPATPQAGQASRQQSL